MTPERPMFPPPAAQKNCAQSAQFFPAQSAGENRSMCEQFSSRPAPPAKTCSGREQVSTCSEPAPLIATSSIAAASRNGIPHDLATRFADFYGRWREQRRRDEFETVEDPDLISWQALNSELFDLQALIMSHRPQTIDDLVLQARACALVNHDLWTDAATIEVADAGARSHRQLLENVAALARVELLPGVHASAN